MSNTISFTGRLGKDAIVKQVGQTSVCEFSVACDSGYGEKKTTTWLNAKLWGAQGEKMAQYLTKGKQVFVSGELTLREYQSKEGATKTSAEVRVHAIDLIGGREGTKDAQTGPSEEKRGEVAHKQSGEKTADDGSEGCPF